MSKVRFNKTELKVLSEMQGYIGYAVASLKGLEFTLEMWKMEQLRKKGFDTRVNTHEINTHTGVIKVVKPPKVEGGAEILEEDEGHKGD